MKRGLNAFAKSIDSSRPAQCAQAEMNRNLFVIGQFRACLGTSLSCDLGSCWTKWNLGNYAVTMWSQCTTEEGVRSRSNVRESRRFMKNHVQTFVSKRPRTYEKHLRNLFKSPIPDISTSM